MTVFNASSFEYPYRNISFPGQHSEEKLLFVTREGRIMLWARMAFVLLAMIVLMLLTLILSRGIGRYVHWLSLPLMLAGVLAVALFGLIALYWVYTLWKKSLFIITTRRLTKFIYTTPWNRYQLSLGLDKIVDTGAYQKGYFQALTGLGYFVARSSAGNVKNFKILNISFAEDLHNYVNKLLFAFNKESGQLDQFRPFIPHLKGDARDKFVRNVTPEFGKKVEE